MATILIKKRDTTGAPGAGDLTNSTGGAELAVNTFDKRLYTKDSGGNVVELGTTPTTVTTGAGSFTSLSVSGTTTVDDIAAASGDFTYLNVSGITDLDVINAGTGTFAEITVGGDLTASGTTHVREVAEFTNIQAVAASGTMNLDWLDGGVLYLTGTATSDFNINIRGESGVSLNSVLATGEAAGFTVLIAQGASGHEQLDLLVDGVTASPYWQNGSQPAAGDSGIDVYAGTVIKTGSGTFTVLESLTNFGQ
jgi:hypothetical protein